MIDILSSCSLSSELQDQLSTLESYNIDSPRLSAEVLLAYTLGITRQELLKQIILQPNSYLTSEQKNTYCELVRRRANGEPVAYIVGAKEFYGREFFVTRNTLIPRPETELLVEYALDRVKLNNTPVCFADLGTGSGCIGITIALEEPKTCGLLIDKSHEALKVANKNKSSLQCNNVQTVLGDFNAPPLAENSLSLVVSNPPYVSKPEYDNVSNEVKFFEPKDALIPRETSLYGLEDLFSIACISRRLLMQRGWLLMEMGYNQGESVKQFLLNKGWSNVSILKDLAGLDRIACAQKKFS